MTAAPTSNMDLSDVPRAASADLWLLIQIMVECEHGLLFLRGVTDVDRAKIEDRFWNDFEGGTERGVVALMRFWCLVDIQKPAPLQTYRAMSRRCAAHGRFLK